MLGKNRLLADDRLQESMIIDKVPPKVMVAIAAGGLLILLVFASSNSFIRIGSNPQEVMGKYRILNIPEDPEDLVGGEYFTLGPKDSLQLRPDTSKPDCRQYGPCNLEVGRWLVIRDQIILIFTSSSIKGKIVGDTIIFEDDSCGRRSGINDCSIVERMGGKTYAKVNNSGCTTLEEARVFAFAVNFKIPGSLPEGYEFKCALGVGPEIYLNFAPKDVNISSSHYGLPEGAIIIFATDEGRYVGEEFASKNTTELIISQCETSIFHPMCKVINGRMTFIKDGCLNLGKAVVDVECRVNIVDKCAYASEIRFFDRSVSYRIQAYMSASQLVSVVESMR